MALDEQTVREFLESYGEALSAGETSAVAARWEVPALVLDDSGSVTVSHATEVRDFFDRAVAWYREQGLVRTVPELVGFTAIEERMAFVDVRWSALDASGAVQHIERSCYFLRADDRGQPRIRVSTGQ